LTFSTYESSARLDEFDKTTNISENIGLHKYDIKLSERVIKTKKAFQKLNNVG